MLQRPVDWQLCLLAALLLGLAGWAAQRLFLRAPARPAGVAAPGVAPRFQDAPEGPPARGPR